MLKTRVVDLPGCAPQPSGTRPVVGWPHSTDDAMIERVLDYVHETLAFTCRYKGESIFYHLTTLNEKTAHKIATILNRHKGQP